MCHVHFHCQGHVTFTVHFLSVLYLASYIIKLTLICDVIISNCHIKTRHNMLTALLKYINYLYLSDSIKQVYIYIWEGVPALYYSILL